MRDSAAALVLLLMMAGSRCQFLGANAAGPTSATSPSSKRFQKSASSDGSPTSPCAPHLPSVGLSSLVDGETGRVFWQGGPGSMRLSSGTIARMAGLRHVRSSALTALLALAALSALAARIREGLYNFADSVTAGGERLHRTALALGARIAAVLLWLPRFERWFFVLVCGLYLLESYCCSTRRYLENALSGPYAVEEYVESLREERPEVEWKVRCFHYETRRLGPSPLGKKNGVEGASDVGGESSTKGTSTDDDSWKPSVCTRKVVTHKASKKYKFTSWSDSTVAGLWKRAQSSDVNAPFAKISLSKMLVLSNAKARQDYFRQQSHFVSEEGQRDQYAEFSTSIKVKGFKPKVLAIRPIPGTSQPKLFRIHVFWFFTLLGMTVPYRIWFSRHCDEIRVTIVKETSSSASKELATVSAAGKEERALSLLPSWLPFQPQPQQRGTNGGATVEGARERPGEDFRRKMQQISLYREDNITDTERDTKANNETEHVKESPTVVEEIIAK